MPSLFMASYLGLVFECTGAEATLERFVTLVGSQVAREVRFSQKAHGTEMAVKWPHTRVGTKVHHQVAPSRKPVTAVVTTECTLA